MKLHQKFEEEKIPSMKKFGLHKISALDINLAGNFYFFSTRLNMKSLNFRSNVTLKHQTVLAVDLAFLYGM